MKKVEICIKRTFSLGFSTGRTLIGCLLSSSIYTEGIREREGVAIVQESKLPANFNTRDIWTLHICRKRDYRVFEENMGWETRPHYLNAWGGLNSIMLSRPIFSSNGP